MPLDTAEQVLAVLAETPVRIAAAARGVPAAELCRRPAPDEWSANDVLAHLRACSDVWGDCMARILDTDTPTLRAMNPRTWMERTDYPEQPFGSSLAVFAEQRAGLLDLLSGLPETAWSRAAVVTGAGRTLERTVMSYASWLASHERPHVRQIERVVGARR